MAIVTPDIKEGTLYLDQTGYHDSRVYHVDGLLATDPVAKKFEAMIAAGIPAMFERHPIVPDCAVLKISSDPVSSDRMTVSVEYGPATFAGNVEPSETAAPMIETGATVQTVQTQLDVNDRPLSVTYTSEDPDTGEQTTATYIATAEKSIPLNVIRYSRREPVSPLNKALQYVGKINAGYLGIYPPRTLLCTEISGRSSDGGRTYDVQYVFQRCEASRPTDTWDVDIVFRNSDGEVPSDATTDNGIRKGVPLYATADFGALHL